MFANSKIRFIIKVMVESAYIHIPFCKTKCKYCSFVSFADFSQKKEYFFALEQEISSRYRGEVLNTLYIGGGTPSLLSCEELEKIVSGFKIPPETEITLECNPEDVTENFLYGVKSFGVNRLSMGCQTFDDGILKLIGRRHSSKKVEEAVKIAQNTGFKNISLDFIYGLPKQTENSFVSDLVRAVELGVQHISLYGLKIDEGCFFYKNLPADLPDNDAQAKMYISAVNFLSKNGFEHYEISNFSKIGFNSKHNTNYWKNNFYYGFGVGAHGYESGVRYSNETSISKYIKNPVEHEFAHALTLQERLEEEIFLGFRLMCGVNVAEIERKFGINFEEKYSKILEKYLASGHLSRTHDGYRLTLDGILVSNYILADFLE